MTEEAASILVVDDEHAGRAAARLGRHHGLLTCRGVALPIVSHVRHRERVTRPSGGVRFLLVWGHRVG